MDVEPPWFSPEPSPTFLARRILLVGTVVSENPESLHLSAVGSQPPSEKLISLPVLNLLFWGPTFVVCGLSGGTPKSLAETPRVTPKMFVDRLTRRPREEGPYVAS